MKRLVPLLIVALAVGCTSMPTRPAPTFKGRAQDREAYSMLDLVKKGPLVVVFVRLDDPITNEAIPYYGLLAEAYKGQANFVGVGFGNDEKVLDWVTKSFVRFPVISDPEQQIVKLYGVTESPTAVVIGPDSQIIGTWSQFSAKNFREISEAVSQLLHREPARVALDTAPAKPMAGRRF